MIQRDSKFFARSREVVKRFLRSVVLADDRAFDPPAYSMPAKRIDPPLAPDDALDNPVADEGGADPFEADAPERDKEHAFEAAAIVRNFAKHELLATVAPIQKDAPMNDVAWVVGLARRADVLTLDWQVGHDHANTFPLEVIQRVRQEDKAQGGRLRLVVIYTGDKDLGGVIATICAREGLVRDEGASSVTDRHTRYVALGKPSSNAGDVVEYSELPGRLIEEFTELTSGLLSNLALRGFAELRDRTHVVLAKAARELDAAYIAHRVHCTPTEAAEDFAVDLLVDECGSLLRDADVRQEVGAAAVDDRLDAWLDRDFAEGAETLLGLKTKELLMLGVDRVEHHEGRGGSKKKFDEWKRRSHRDTTSRLAKWLHAHSGDTLNERFAVFSTQLAAPHLQRALTLGTILRSLGDGAAEGAVLVCLQPRCDTVRVSAAGHGFVFAGATQDNERFDLVLAADGGVYGRYRVELGAKVLRCIPFRGDTTSGLVLATLDGERHVFEDSDGNKYEHIGQLKDGYAQRYANQLAAAISRVGVDMFEWLRRSDNRRG